MNRIISASGVVLLVVVLILALTGHLNIGVGVH